MIAVQTNLGEQLRNRDNKDRDFAPRKNKDPRFTYYSLDIAVQAIKVSKSSSSRGDIHAFPARGETATDKQIAFSLGPRQPQSSKYIDASLVDC